MKPHYYEVIADLRFRIAKATEELTLLDVAHSQIATRRVQLQTNRAGMEELAEELEEFIAQTGLDEPGTPEEAKPFRLEVGKRYVRRDGCNTDPLTRSATGFFVDPSEPYYIYSESGSRFGLAFSEEGNDTDLISEYMEPDSSEGWEFFQSSIGSLWAFRKNSSCGLYYPGWGDKRKWESSGQDYSYTANHPTVAPIPNLPPGIPMP